MNSTPSMSLNAGQAFGNYEIVRLLGRGGMGEVYLAKDSRLNRPVAIKILSSELLENAEVLARFKREARLCASLSHPGICTIHETGTTNGYTYICMEYVEGKNLRELIAESELPVERVLDIGIQIADALGEARKKNIVHRDIKSANIIINARDVVKVLDFGLARRLRNSQVFDGTDTPTESSITQFGSVQGTVAYMAPEQAFGKPLDHRSDIFSFGVVLYEMLTGRLPFVGETITEVIDAILHKTPVSVARFNDAVSPDLIRVLNKMLEKDPEMRYQSVHEVWVDLKRIKAELTESKPAKASFIRKRRGLSVTLALIIVAVIASVLLFPRRQKPPEPGITPIKKQIVSIAVLPFEYLGEDPTRQYLGGLVTDGLIAALQPVPEVAIAPYANVREIKAKSSIQDVAHDLSVRWVIRGSVSAMDQNIGITTEVFSANGSSVWKQTITGRPIETLDRTAKSIVRVLPVPKANTTELQQLRTPNLRAYRKYLEGRDRQQGWDVESNLDKAIVLYRDALKDDPDFAAAHAALASALVAQFRKRNEPMLLSTAGEESRKALGLDPNLPEALLAYGLVQAESGNSIEAHDAFVRALEIAPGDDAACRALASMYSISGRMKEAKEMYERAIALRPNYWINQYAFGTFNWQFAGDLHGARIHLEKANELHPSGYAPVVMLGNLHLTQGHLEEAEAYFRKALERAKNPYAYSNLGLVYYYRGQYELALRNWQALLKEAPDKPSYRANIADALRQLGRKEEALGHYREVIKSFRAALKTNRSDDTTRAYLAMALAATHQCEEATKETRALLARHAQSPELSVYAAITASRCEDLEWAKQIVVDSIATDNLLTIRFDPDLEPIRQLPEVKNALKRVAETTP